MSESENLQPQASDPMFCKYCGTRLYKKSAFCPSCGKQLRQTPPQQPEQFQQAQQPQQPQQFQQPQQTYYSQNQQGRPLMITDVARYHLLSAAKWIRICAIISTIFCIVIAFFVLYILTKYGSITGSNVTSYEFWFLLFLFAISIYPIIKSFSFSSRATKAVELGDTNELQECLSDLRGLATFMGIIAIILLMLLLYGVALFFI